MNQERQSLNVIGFVRRQTGKVPFWSVLRSAADHAPDLGAEWRDRLSRRVRGTVRRASDVASQGARQLGEATEHTSRLITQGAEGARDAARQTGERIQSLWAPEDPARVLDESRLFDPLPGEANQVPPELLSLRWRNEAMLALSSVGVLSLEDEIIRHTDRLFHQGLPTPALSKRLFGEDYRELHRWIDTVPGRSVAGGGITHRMEHGHDLAAARQVYREHGLEGLLVWTQHVGQDVFSITGIPIPVGGKSVSTALVDGGMPKGKAALLVSFNAAELAASFLAGAFAVRLAAMLAEVKRRRQVRNRCAAAYEARRRGDLDAVIGNYAEARSLSDDPMLSLALGWAYREIGRPAAQSFLEFRRAALELASEDRTIDLNGVAVSLRGLAYLLALVEAPQVIHRKDLERAWRQELERMVNGAVASFEGAAISQSERPGVSIAEQSFEWRPRPLSAGANYYLAGRAVAAVPFVGSSGSLDRLRSRALGMLRRAETDVDEDRRGELRGVATRWEHALASDVGLVGGA